MKKSSLDKINKIFNFWFGPEVNNLAGKSMWFQKSDSTDEYIQKNFHQDLMDLVDGKFDDWKETPEGLMASIILVDQFTRNMFRGSPDSWKYDNLARSFADLCVEKEYDMKLEPIQRSFVYLPYEHAEDMDYQEKSLRLFMKLKKEMNHPYYDEVYQYAQHHYDIVKKFGRFPHRNKVLGRVTTEEEAEFLKDPKNSF